MMKNCRKRSTVLLALAEDLWCNSSLQKHILQAQQALRNYLCITYGYFEWYDAHRLLLCLYLDCLWCQHHNSHLIHCLLLHYEHSVSVSVEPRWQHVSRSQVSYLLVTQTVNVPDLVEWLHSKLLVCRDSPHPILNETYRHKSLPHFSHCLYNSQETRVFPLSAHGQYSTVQLLHSYKLSGQFPQLQLTLVVVAQDVWCIWYTLGGSVFLSCPLQVFYNKWRK